MAMSPTDLQSKISAIPASRKILAAGGIAASLAVIAVIILWANQPVYRLLYSNLSAEDAGTIAERLKGSKVPYEIRDGNTIFVPEDRVHEIRLLLASEGIPSGGGVGFEIFDRTTIGMTDFVQKLNYKRALQGELARTIAQLAEVELARVHLAVPEKTLFSERRETASASVVLKLRNGRALSQNQVHGVINLVAGSVEGLDSQNITIVDTNGNVLSRPSEGPYGATLTSYQVEYQKNLEKSVEERVQSMLERAVGREKVVVRVSSALDFKQIETTEERYDPDNVAVRSEQRTQENSSGSSTTALGTASGVPGVVSNLPGVRSGDQQVAGEKGGASSQSRRMQETINYEINKTVNHILEPVGSLKRLSTAVLIDGSYETIKGEDGKDVRKYIPRTGEEINKYTEIVKKAIGYNEERGDQVEVVNIPFEPSVSAGDINEDAETGSSFNMAAFLPFIKYGIVGITVLLVFLFIVRPLMKTVILPGPRLAGLPADMSIAGDFPRVGELEAAAAHPRQQMDSDAKTREEVIKIVRENPQHTAKLIKTWMTEE